MLRKQLHELAGNEILARDIVNRDYQVILPKGAMIQKSYIQKLGELGITELYIRAEDSVSCEMAILKYETEEAIRKTVKDILERHTYHNNQELAQLGSAADDIIDTILAEKQLVDKVFDIKERSADIYEHSISICSMAILTALKLGIERKKIHDIGVGCLLHDIGLRYIAIDYNNQDLGTLNRQELAEYRKHPVYGYSSLKDEAWISELSKAIILYHHECMNGSGFPLRVKNMPLECRIVNVCDAFDEMICGIACRRVKVYEAVEFLKSFKNIMFDGKIVDVFLGFTAVYPAGTYVLTNEGELAVVLSQNKEFSERPVIRILKDSKGNDIKGTVIKDLIKIRHIFIEKALDKT